MHRYWEHRAVWKSARGKAVAISNSPTVAYGQTLRLQRLHRQHRQKDRVTDTQTMYNKLTHVTPSSGWWQTVGVVKPVDSRRPKDTRYPFTQQRCCVKVKRTTSYTCQLTCAHHRNSSARTHFSYLFTEIGPHRSLRSITKRTSTSGSTPIWSQSQTHGILQHQSTH